ncbi:hypothetical protein BDR04DRAFT_1054093 [Suillus decipiens]|nr:hypothetical protein BDR04DRAFT_1054093 [Suillus decipiens]
MTITIDVVVSKLTCLNAKAPSSLYIYKSGPSWRIRKVPQAQDIECEARPVYRHAIEPTWRSIAKRIYNKLDSIGVEWMSINPLAYAYAGEAKPFCSLILSIGVKPHTLPYDAAVTAAAAVMDILAEAGFPAIEVAFINTVVTCSVAAGPKLLSFEPSSDKISDLRKPFTHALGLSIAPLKCPHFEGTAALYFRLSKDDNRAAILTCAHVAHPPPVFSNTSMTRKRTSQPCEEFVVLGNRSYSKAVEAMISTIREGRRSTELWNDVLSCVGEPVDGEDSKTTMRREEHVELVANAKEEIEELDAIYDEVTKHRTTPSQRVIGFVLHSQKIEVSVEPHNFTNDWALIELYDEKIDWPTFKGNKVYIGGNLSVSDFGNTMFPQLVDQANYQYPRDGFLQDDEIRNPQHLDVHGEKCLLVLKNGSTTGTTVGRANGLESFTRIYKEYGIKHTSIEIAVLPYDSVPSASG